MDPLVDIDMGINARQPLFEGIPSRNSQFNLGGGKQTIITIHFPMDRSSNNLGTPFTKIIILEIRGVQVGFDRPRDFRRGHVWPGRMRTSHMVTYTVI